MTLVTSPSNVPLPTRADTSGSVRDVLPTLVEVLACGTGGHGDDSAALAALADLEVELPADVRVRLVGQLVIDDLLAVPSGAGVVVVDTVTGLDPGWVAELDIAAVADPELGIRARGSNALSIPETLGLASMIRGHPLHGVVVAIGGRSFLAGDGLSWPVAAAIGTFRLAIADAIDRVRAQVSDAGTRRG